MAEQVLKIDVSGLEISPGLVTLPVHGERNNFGKEQRKIKFLKLTDVLADQHEKKISDKFRIALVQGILFCVKRNISPNVLQSCDRPIYISEDRSTINVLRPAGADSTAIKRLSETFKDILRNNMICKDAQSIADDFLELATNGDLTVESAMKHPLFWTAADKILYFKKCCGDERRKRTCNISVESMIGVNCWISLLNNSDEKQVADLRIGLYKRNGDLSIDNATVKHCAQENTYRDYSGTKWRDFLCFFRNIHAHFYEQNESIKCCFGNNENEGYWNFFRKQFPGLLMKLRKHYSSDMKGLQTGIEPKFLPDIYEQNVPASDGNAIRNAVSRPNYADVVKNTISPKVTHRTSN